MDREILEQIADKLRYDVNRKIDVTVFNLIKILASLNGEETCACFCDSIDIYIKRECINIIDTETGLGLNMTVKYYG